RFNQKPVTLEKFISAFLENIISGDGKALEKIEYDISMLEDKVVRDYDCKNFNEQLMIYKKKLLILRNYYEQLIEIGHELFENENKIFSVDNLRYFKVFTEKTERLCSNVCLLRESIVQLREVYQANLDLRLNNTMKLFTVITTIFSPLSFIAGWYGMNFKNMPELNWKYGYISVIVVCIAAVCICLYIFKKKKLM
ncbi:MAG: CorA family divalent cation transporter, partial [Clostridia bacterium]|nr:CorA family divalent cation transporter [Clostridia bacterium]